MVWKKQQTIAYFELNKPRCLHFEELYAHNGVVVLGRMANAWLMWIANESGEYTKEEKAFNAAFSIAQVYEQEKYKLGPTAQQRFFIDISELQKKETNHKKR